MKGIGSDKDAITEIICFRTFDRLNKVKEKFKEKYGKELVSELKVKLLVIIKKLL